MRWFGIWCKFILYFHGTIDIVEPKQLAHSPLLAAGLASKLKTDYIPYGRRLPVRSATGSFKRGKLNSVFPVFY
jgi:hypothetical protein